MEIAIDIETTGTNTFKDRILTIGLYNTITEVCMHLYPDKLDDNDEKLLVDDFIHELKYQNTSKLIGWKIKDFDIPFIKAKLLKYNLFEHIKYLNTLTIIDIHDIIVRDYIVKNKSISSNEIYYAFGIENKDKFNGKDMTSIYKIENWHEYVCEHNYNDLIKISELYKNIKPIL